MSRVTIWLVIRGGKIAESTPFYFDTAAMLAGRHPSTAERKNNDLPYFDRSGV
jgi:hypothetical protein